MYRKGFYMIIGITGNSGSGKTSISKLLKQNLNADIINADEIVKEMSMPGAVYYNEIIKAFGEDILLENCEINKPKLADIIFKDNEKREVLDLLTFRYIVEEIKTRADSSKSKIVIIDAPLLIESKLNEICDIVISVISDEDIKLKRICSRDNIDKNTALNRINAQPKNEFYIKNSNLVIINNNSDLEKQVEGIKELIESELIKNEEIVIIKSEDIQFIQFKRLLEFEELTHAFTIKPLDFGSNDTYKKIEEDVNENYKSICELLKIDSKNIIRPYQTHTSDVKEVNDETGIFNENFIDIDGLMTNKKGKILSLSFADCTPIYLFDKNKKVIGNIHSGWQGTVKKISKKSIKFMKEKFGSNPEDIICVIGPTIRKCHFEVKQDVRDIFYNEFKYMQNIDNIINYNQETDSYFIDTVEINKNLLQEEGILEENIIDSKVCTFRNSKIIHSYRKEGKKTGRNTALICLK